MRTKSKVGVKIRLVWRFRELCQGLNQFHGAPTSPFRCGSRHIKPFFFFSLQEPGSCRKVLGSARLQHGNGKNFVHRYDWNKMVVGLACRLPRNSSRDSAAVTLCGSLFQSVIVLVESSFWYILN